MYEVRCTKYDLKVSARCAGDAERKRSQVLEQRAGLEGMRQKECTKYDLKACALRDDAKRKRSRIFLSDAGI